MEAVLWRVLQLALMGGEYAIRAAIMRDRIKAMRDRGGATAEEIAALEAESNDILAAIEMRLSED